MLSGLADGFAWIDAAISAGTLPHLVGLYLLLLVGEHGIKAVLRRMIHREFIVAPPGGYRGHRLLTLCLPSYYLLRMHPAVTQHTLTRFRWVSEATFPRLQMGLFTILHVVEEEIVFRGIPFAVATLTIGPAWLLVGFGTTCWAFMHGKGRGIALVMTCGWFYAWLWIAGHWHLVIGFHLATNAIGLALHWLQHQVTS